MAQEPIGRFRARLAKVVEVGAADDTLSRAYDFWITLVIAVNIVNTILGTFSELYTEYGAALDAVEAVTAALFALDYVLRLISARYIYHQQTELRGVLKYVFSFTGLVDLLSFLPCYLPFFFPGGAVAFRVFRIVRIFRLFRINAYYDSLNAIGEVLAKKKQQLLSSVFIILVLMLSSSLCMYSVENAAQPEVFANAFSGIWWAVSTLLTVGYGDIYPITALGRVLGAIITFLGVGMVAIPTGIISAGFVEQYAELQNSAGDARESELSFIRIRLDSGDAWIGQNVAGLRLPHDMLLTAIQRGRELIIPRGDVRLEKRDTLVLAAEPLRDSARIHLRELVLGERNPWSGQYIRDLDISRQTMIVMVRRKGQIIIPKGSTRLKAGDTVLVHTKKNLPHSVDVEV